MEVGHDPVAAAQRLGLALRAPPRREAAVELVQLARGGGEALRLRALARTLAFAPAMSVVLGQPEQGGRGQLGLLGQAGRPDDCRSGRGGLERDPVEELLDHAEAEGLGAIAVTDHNVFGGASEAVELARDRGLVVIPGEEVKTADQGEVIGLFLSEEIPRGLSFGETVAAIRAQGGIVYLPHPFDRLHAIPEPATLHRHLAQVDVLEVYNARLLF
ncbi:MAG TPA: PHP domain-containing protein, partial [Gaiellaceae bacterium]|nr:PHP domain-containing protein [Gaiellaceae bacterium]